MKKKKRKHFLTFHYQPGNVLLPFATPRNPQLCGKGGSATQALMRKIGPGLHIDFTSMAHMRTGGLDFALKTVAYCLCLANPQEYVRQYSKNA